MTFLTGDVENLPYPPLSNNISESTCSEIAVESVSLARADWNNFETSWDFQDLPLLREELKAATLAASWANWDRYCRDNIARMKELEEENNRLWIDAYGLQDELTPEVPERANRSCAIGRMPNRSRVTGVLRTAK